MHCVLMVLLPVFLPEPRSPAESGTYFIKSSSASVVCTEPAACLCNMLAVCTCYPDLSVYSL